MIIVSYNIGGGLLRKFSEILDIVGQTNPDVLSLSEAEVHEPPNLNGYYSYTEVSSNSKKRLLVYVKTNLNAVRQEHEVCPDGDIPFVCLKLSTVTIVALYNQHTQFAYTRYRKRLSRGQMFSKFTSTVEYFLTHSNTKNLLVVGDVNLRWNRNEYAVCEWASKNDLMQWIKVPTRENAILDHIYTRNIVPREVEVMEKSISDHKGIKMTIGKNSSKTKTISYLNLKPENVKSIHLKPRSFVELESELSELQNELMFAQESLGTTRSVDANPKMKWRCDPRIRKIKKEIEVLKADKNNLNPDISTEKQLKILNYKLQ